MRILIMGSGGVGGYYGAMLAEQGHQVTFVARGAHLDALRERGLEVRTAGRTLHLQPVSAVAEPAEADGPFELVLFTVKGYDTDAAATALRPVVGPDTTVLTLQNGIESVQRLNAILGPRHVLAGTTRLESTIVAPGLIEQRSPFRDILLNEQSGQPSARVEAIAAALSAAGANVKVTDPGHVIWDKFIMLAANSTLTSVCMLPMGQIRSSAEGAALYRQLIAEAVAVGRASGVDWPENVVDRSFQSVLGMPATMTTSMMRDYERQSRVELEQITGAMVRRGRELGVPTPGFEVLYAVLKARALSFGGLG